MATEIALLQQGQLLWFGSTNALLADAQECVWSLTLDADDFERLRNRYHISTVLRRGREITLRLVSSARPHPNATSVEPTLEEAYLFISSQMPNRKESIPTK